MHAKTISLGLILVSTQVYANESIHDAELNQKRSYIFEVNPLLFAKQGIGVSGEVDTEEQVSLGIDIEYYKQYPYKQEGVSATNTQYGVGAKLRYFFFEEKLSGPFIGLKVLYSYYHLKIFDYEQEKTFQSFFVAPIAQVGYRLILESTITVSGFFGFGYRFYQKPLQNNSFSSEKRTNKNWQDALSTSNPTAKRLQPDFGFTLGLKI
ncbi:MAG: porin family protein [Silvanigrellaceae bacterium]|nr:porin family protein [Silvanigrellaceae bacterium]